MASRSCVHKMGREHRVLKATAPAIYFRFNHLGNAVHELCATLEGNLRSVRWPAALLGGSCPAGDWIPLQIVIESALIAVPGVAHFRDARRTARWASRLLFVGCGCFH